MIIVSLHKQQPRSRYDVEGGGGGRDQHCAMRCRPIFSALSLTHIYHGGIQRIRMHLLLLFNIIN